MSKFNLDEAAIEYANKEYPDEAAVGQWGTGDYEPPVDMEYSREIAKDAFKAGAEWQEKQMKETHCLRSEKWKEVEETARHEYENGWKDCKELMMSGAVDAVVSLEAGGFPFIEFGVSRFGLKVGDKIKVIIVKDI